MRLPQFAIMLVSVVVTIVCLGAVGGLDTVEVATMSIVMSGALIIWYLRHPRHQPGPGPGPRPRARSDVG
jgi:hypothetical protein